MKLFLIITTILFFASSCTKHFVIEKYDFYLKENDDIVIQLKTDYRGINDHTHNVDIYRTEEDAKNGWANFLGSADCEQNSTTGLITAIGQQIYPHKIISGEEYWLKIHVQGMVSVIAESNAIKAKVVSRSFFVGQDSDFLMREMGAPTKKEKDSNGEIWFYETTSSKIFPEQEVISIIKKDAEGKPTLTESKTFPAYEKISIMTKCFFFDSNGQIYDTKYDW